MASSQHTPPSRENSDTTSHNRQSRMSEHMAHSAGVQRVRNDESWVEISSQPSSSSLSSAGDDIVTTGLRVQHDYNVRRRRRVHPGVPSRIGLEGRQTSTSSQEEYEESESEEDHVMTSSNEHVLPATHLPPTGYEAQPSDSEDEHTALGRRTSEPVFTPQPNAFSHPPSSSHNRPSAPGSYFPDSSRNPNPYASRRQASYNQADHDAALRASLTTLLSIGAAAARGKRNASNPIAVTNPEPIGLRLIPESELTGNVIQPNISRPLSPSTRARSSPSVSSQEVIEKGKRKAAASAEKTKRRKRIVVQDGEEGAMMWTWVMSAGVLVLVSVVGFGAGYVIGREVGRQEVSTLSFPDGASCGREAVRETGSLRRFKWGIGGGGRSVVA